MVSKSTKIYIEEKILTVLDFEVTFTNASSDLFNPAKAC